MKNDIRNDIMETAANLFSETGFHGTSIRDISRVAKCSLSMVYYYFNDKETLYYELAYHEFLKLNERMDREMPMLNDPEEFYIQALLKRLNLEGYDRQIYKLSLMTYYSFENTHPLFIQLKKWQESRPLRTSALLKSTLGIDDEIYGRMLSNQLEISITRKLLLDYSFSNEEAIKEVHTLFQMIKEIHRV